MAWFEFKSRSRSADTRIGVVSVSRDGPHGKKLYIAFGDTRPKTFVKGALVSLRFGTAEHAGMLRVERAPAGYKLQPDGEATNGIRLMAAFPDGVGIPRRSCSRRPVEIVEISENHVVLRIPRFDAVVPPTATPARTPVPQSGSLMSGSIARPHPGPTPADARVRAALKDVENHRKGTK